MDKLTPEQRHKNMSHIKNKDSKIEKTLRKALWDRGYRYRKNYKKLTGCPDIVLTKQRICIFCDSEFFHGKDWDDLQEQLKRGKNGEFWIEKIRRNIERDREVERDLRVQEWTVLRFWGKDILKDVDKCVKEIEDAINEKRYDVEL